MRRPPHQSRNCCLMYFSCLHFCREIAAEIVHIYLKVIISGTVLILIAEADADSGVDESTQNGSPSKPSTGIHGSLSRIPKKTPPSTPSKNSRGRDLESRHGRPPVRSRSVPKPFTSYGLTPVEIDEPVPIKKGRPLLVYTLLSLK